MSMTPEEFKQYVKEAVCDKYKKRREVPLEEKVKYLKEKGWKCINNDSKDSSLPSMWSRTDIKQSSVSINAAYVQAILEDPNESDMSIEEWFNNTSEKERYKRKFPCNKCGETIIKYFEEEEGDEHPGGYYGEEITYSGGYLSDPLEDTMVYRFVLCEKCLYELMLTFKNPPKIDTYMP